MTGLIYLLQVNLYLLFFYLFYLAFLRNETFFNLNRLYLLASALLAIAIPLVEMKWIETLFVTKQIYQTSQSVSNAVFHDTLITTNSQKFQSSSAPFAGLQISQLFWLIYGCVTTLLLINFVRRLYIVNRAFKGPSKNHAFSFFSKILIDEDLQGKETIRDHEMVHIRQWHSLDVIFFELLAIFNWFNPIAYLYRKSIKNIHEYIADDSVASTLEDRSAYALLLVSNVFSTQPQKLTNSFFNQSLLKRRIMMLHKTKSRRIAILKYGLSAPLFAGMVIFSSATTMGKQAVAQLKETVQTYTPEIVKSEAIATGPAAQKVTTIKSTKVNTRNEEQQPVATPKNLLEYVTKLYSSISLNKIGKEGNIYVSFKVGKDKRVSDFEIKKSIGSDWEKDLITALEAFSDTVDMPKGTYHFILGFAFGGNDDLLEISKNEPAPLFKKWRVEGPGVGTAKELEGGMDVHNTYVSFITLPNPMVIVDGKEVSYTHTKMGLKLTQSIHPRVAASHITLKGDKAVEKYGESARAGIVVIETKEKDF